MSGMIKNTIKMLTSAILAGVIMLAVFPVDVHGDDLIPDNPDDGIITVNEQRIAKYRMFSDRDGREIAEVRQALDELGMQVESLEQ